MDALSLDQFAVFAAVVEEGSFAAAARRMNRAQSAVTYAIQKLEEQSGSALFDRSTYRPVLTEAGKALLPRAQLILTDLEEYRLHARRLVMGLEEELRLAVYPYAAPNMISEVLRHFRREFPFVRITASLAATDSAGAALENGDCDLALMLEVGPLGEAFERAAFTSIELIAVASANHPLARLNHTLKPEDLRDHTLVLVHGAFNRQEESVVRGYGVDVVAHAWRIVDFEMKRQLLLSGVGWGAMPRDRVEDDLAAGRLVALRMGHWENETLRMPLVVAHAKNRTLGPAGRWLFDRFSRNEHGAHELTSR
jgi:DNA-binding transcriptional LysR family regulator